MKNIFFTTLLLSLVISCREVQKDVPDDDVSEAPKKPRIAGPEFNSDSAYSNIKIQVEFGPRVPGTKPHTQCRDFFIASLRRYGLQVETQSTPVTLPVTGKTAQLTNIFASFHPERKDRILLLAHWDTRPVADMDNERKNEPIPGADDGGSGTGVLLEMARILQLKDPNIGVDFLLVDGEDSGLNNGNSDTWCLGSQHWARNKKPDYKPRFAILLDMVGGGNPVFPREGTSVEYAPFVVEKVWSAAARLGYGNIFTNDITGMTTDDHLFINDPGNIPAIDIVHYNVRRQGYPEWHHKHSDNMDIIDPSTLAIVGAVLVDVIYNENPPL